MAALQFDGSDDNLRWDTLASALANVSDGAWTVAALIRRNGTGSGDAMSYLFSGTGDGTARAGISFETDNTVVVDVDPFGIGFPTALTNTTSPYLFVASKPAGTGTPPRLSWKLGSAGAWTDENAGATLADQAVAATMLRIGTWQGTQLPFIGWIGVVAWWEGEMSDDNKHALDDNWQTSDWWNSAHGQPAFLAQLNVEGASVVDLAGNASSLTVTGTSLAAGEMLDGWTFDGTGSLPIPAYVPARRVPKRLAGPAQLTNSAATKYTAPDGYRAMIRSVHVSNPTGAAVDFTLSIGADAAGTRLYDGYSIPSDSYKRWFLQEWLEPGEIIQAFASTGAALVLTIDGFERPAG